MRRPTVILLVLFALLGGLVWYAQQPNNSIKRALATSTSLVAQPSNLTLINPSKGLVTSLVIQDAKNKKVSISKSSGKWIINTGVEAPADQSSVDRLAGQMLSLDVVSKLQKAPDPTGTGLDKPSYLVTFTQDDGTISNFKIGKLTATSSGYYIEAADGSVSIVDKNGIEALIGNLDQPPFPTTATPSVSVTPEATSTKAP